METIKRLEVTPVFCEDDIPKIPSQFEKAKVYVSEKHNRIGLNCLCGCGTPIILPVNINPRGWQLQIDDKKRITLVGSILQQKCGAHYIITNNKANFTNL